ncbi:ABC transporter permease [Paludisphaera mucosa]|uniref:ABC transporter permease n=1 Tax=Paludisphaera mucosa TaxID=3030827 RepID=A0ABT6FHG5_9BACT|nr:ABC transporter permease [Paludisphaera mucosa]MDG3007028.1 ABC transporter permease [Paludisphaera mucosa]
MSADVATSKPVPAAPAPWAEPVAIANRPSLGALATVLRITVARQMRGKRIWTFVVLFAAPIAIALLVRRHQDPYDPADSERALIFGLIPQAILPLAALLFASSLVQDDVEEQTLTYFLIRPIPRWAIYLVKVLGATLVTSALAGVFTAAAIVAVRSGTPETDAASLLTESGVVAGLSALALAAYVTIFSFLGLLTRRVLVIGVAYILIFEGVVSRIPFLVRNGTILYHVRVLAVRLLGLDGSPWSIDLALAPSVATSLASLLGAAGLFLALGAWIFSTREFRVKTPEGS